MSPFQDLPKSTVPPKKDFPVKSAIIVVYSLVVVLLLIVVVVLLWRRTVDNPYRTLEAFSAEKYFESASSLTGNRFQAKLRVEGDLGWTAGTGRLMVFSVDGDARFLPVLIKGDADRYAFSKGQIYTAQLTVGENGLLYATDLKKN